jgi:sulfite reductase alpha subunit-like flavoprotein
MHACCSGHWTMQLVAGVPHQLRAPAAAQTQPFPLVATCPCPSTCATLPCPQALLPHLHCPCTVRSALTLGLDLRGAPRKSLLRALAEHCSDAAEKRTLLFFTSRAGRDGYKARMAEGCPSLMDLLAKFPSCSPPLEVLLDALPPLAPRQYSLTTAQVAHPDRLQVGSACAWCGLYACGRRHVRL